MQTSILAAYKDALLGIHSGGGPLVGLSTLHIIAIIFFTQGLKQMLYLESFWQKGKQQDSRTVVLNNFFFFLTYPHPQLPFSPQSLSYFIVASYTCFCWQQRKKRKQQGGKQRKKGERRKRRFFPRYRHFLISSLKSAIACTGRQR